MVEAIHKLPDMRTFKICKFGNGYFSDFFQFFDTNYALYV